MVARFSRRIACGAFASTTSPGRSRSAASADGAAPTSDATTAPSRPPPPRVSQSTVYLVFGSRVGLFCALAAHIADRGGFGAVLDAAAQPDAIESLRDGIRAIVAMYASQRDILRAIHSMAQLDAEAVGGSMQKLDQGRATGMTSRARKLAEQRALHPDVTEAQAAHLLWLLTSFDAFDVLYTSRALLAEQVADILITPAERTLVASR